MNNVPNTLSPAARPFAAALALRLNVLPGSLVRAIGNVKVEQLHEAYARSLDLTREAMEHIASGEYSAVEQKLATSKVAFELMRAAGQESVAAEALAFVVAQVRAPHDGPRTH